MAIFVLGILSVATLWIFREKEAMIIALLILIAFNSGLHYFQTEPCRLFTNYITGTCVTVFFVCISRVSFSVNYNHFKQLKKIEYHEQDILKVNEMQTEILAVVAHDLRRPISNVLQIADLLKNSEATVEERNEYYDMIFETCNRSNSIVEDLLDAARSDESHTTFVYTCMNDFMGHALVQFIKSNNHSHEILFVPPTMKIYAMINHQKMMRVFDNVFSNSLKFTAKNGRITVKLTGDEDNVCILVADNGIGIPNDLIPFLFSRFSKSGRTGLNGEKSNGLGLSICKLFLKQHHGDISATSEEGKGTQIKIVLPREVLHSN